MPGGLDDMVDDIADLVDELGATVTFKTESDYAYDPTTGEGTETLGSTVAVVTPPEPFRNRLIDGETVKAGDVKTYLPAKDLTFAPIEGMAVEIGSERWTIVSVETIRTGELVGLYGLHLRR
jgi:hypothetical protein